MVMVKCGRGCASRITVLRLAVLTSDGCLGNAVGSPGTEREVVDHLDTAPLYPLDHTVRLDQKLMLMKWLIGCLLILMCGTTVVCSVRDFESGVCVTGVRAPPFVSATAFDNCWRGHVRDVIDVCTAWTKAILVAPIFLVVAGSDCVAGIAPDLLGWSKVIFRRCVAPRLLYDIFEAARSSSSPGLCWICWSLHC